MTVPSTQRKAGPFNGNGSATSFAFTFKVFSASDIQVTTANAEGIETVRVLGTDYSVTLNPNQETSPGGTITFPLSGSPLAVGSKLSIVGILPYDQPLDLPSGGNFSPLALENELDRAVMQIQQLDERMDRAIVAPVSDVGVDMTLPTAAVRANRYLSFDLTGKPVSTTFDIDAVQNASTSAIAAAAAAAASETAAAASESVANAQAAFVTSTVAAVTPTVVNFSGDGATVAFTLPSSPGADENTLVFISGVYQQKTEYSVSGTTLTFTSAPPVGTNNIEVQIGPATNIAVNTALGVSFLQAGTGAVTRTIQAKLRDTVSVKDFGAVGNGVADDTAAIQAALASGAATVNVPDGVYLSGAITVPSGVTFQGIGNPTLKLKNSTFGAGGNFISGASVTGATVRGFNIDANRQNQTGSVFAIYFNGANYTNIVGNTITNSTYGICATNANHVSVTENTIKNGLFTGILFTLGSTSDTSSAIKITDNFVQNVVSDGTASCDGKGIVVYGKTGLLAANYKNITNVVISNNNCHANGVSGITLIAVNDFTITGNNCYDNRQNTSIGNGICISEGCYNGTISGNVCTNNYDAGILLDVVTQDGRRFDFGRMTVSGNSCFNNEVAGIKINSQPYTTVSGNTVSDSAYGVFIALGGFYTVTGNTISFNTQNGVRLAGITGQTGYEQTHVIISDNIFYNNCPSVSSTYAAIYATFYDTVRIQHNDFQANGRDLDIASTCLNTTLLDNRFTSTLNIASGSSVVRWDDEFRSTISSFTSSDFSGEGRYQFTLAAAFTIPHFGLSLVLIRAAAPVTSSLTVAIADGFIGQKLRLINYDSSSITIKHNANVKNMGSADVVLAFAATVEYYFDGSDWLQIAAKVTVGF
jgi:parallel beta-helix repeat protein